MSNWGADPQLQQLFAQVVTRAFDEARDQEVREQKSADAQLAARGTYLSSGHVVSRAERGQTAFRTAGRRSIDEVLKVLGDIYGTIPPEAIGWIREQLTARFRSHAKSRAALLGDDRLVRQLKLPTVRFEREFNAVAEGLVSSPSTIRSTRRVGCFKVADLSRSFQTLNCERSKRRSGLETRSRIRVVTA